MGSEVQVFPGPPLLWRFRLGIGWMSLEDGAVAQLGERRNRTAEVGGSIPLGSTMWFAVRLIAWARRWGCSSAGRAPALQAGGQRFDPAQLHQIDGVEPEGLDGNVF